MFIPHHTLVLFPRMESLLGDIHPVFLKPVSSMAKSSNRGRVKWLKNDDKVEEELGLFSPEEGRCQVAHNRVVIPVRRSSQNLSQSLHIGLWQEYKWI